MGGRSKTAGKQRFPAGQILSPAQGGIWQGPDSTGHQSGCPHYAPCGRQPRAPRLSVPRWQTVCSQEAAFLREVRTVGFSVTPGVSVRLMSVVHLGPHGQSLARRRCQPRGASPGVGAVPTGASCWPVTRTHAVLKYAAPATGLGARCGTSAAAFLRADRAQGLPGQGLVHLAAHLAMPQAQGTRRGSIAGGGTSRLKVKRRKKTTLRANGV